MSSLSNHEDKQFKRLAESFVSDDPVLARKVDRQAKLREMTCFSAEDVRIVALGGTVVSMLVAFAAFFFDYGGALEVYSALAVSLICLRLTTKYGANRSHVSQREYSDS